ncbi:MAG: two-component system C4-dicarboxylate transport sensor histidine kinase DctB [Candidatus Azotimanducaceae bacterium]
MGQNYGFRPYLQDALQGQRSGYFAIAATSGRSGYFVAEPVSDAANTQKGVIAINEDNIVVLASNPDWLYPPVDFLDSGMRKTTLES